MECEYDMSNMNDRNRSWVWYLLPIFTGIIGGVIAYFAMKQDNLRMAKDCLYIGITLTIVNIVPFAILMAIGFSLDSMFADELFFDESEFDF